MGYFIDRETWPRRQQFEFFRHFEQPFFTLCAEVDVTATDHFCRDQGASFFLATWFLCLGALNREAPFRYRLRGDRVWVHDSIHVSTTVLRKDETFAFCHLPSSEDFAAFEELGRAAIEAESLRSGLTTEDERDDVVYGSVVPWLRFTSVAHGRRLYKLWTKMIFGDRFLGLDTKISPSRDTLATKISVRVMV